MNRKRKRRSVRRGELLSTSLWAVNKRESNNRTRVSVPLLIRTQTTSDRFISLSQYPQYVHQLKIIQIVFSHTRICTIVHKRFRRLQVRLACCRLPERLRNVPPTTFPLTHPISNVPNPLYAFSLYNGPSFPRRTELRYRPTPYDVRRRCKRYWAVQSKISVAC